MRPGTLLLALILASGDLGAKHPRAPAPMPTEFVIGRNTFFDFGPPFNYYEVLVVRPALNGSSVERIMLTPAADECYRPAKIELATATLDESVESMLASTNPCAIPEKELIRESKRCKHCLVFSGASVTMQVRCAEKIRLIHFDVLEQDWFLAHPNTPKSTFWTMKLLEHLDRSLGPGAMDKPMFPIEPEAAVPQPVLNPSIANGLRSGDYDALFPRTKDKPSGLFRAAQIEPAKPVVTLTSVYPARPDSLTLPPYPAIARVARVHGTVKVSGIIGPTGAPALLNVESGNPLLRAAATNAVGEWKFPAEDAGQLMHVMIDFNLNCAAATKPSH